MGATVFCFADICLISNHEGGRLAWPPRRYNIQLCKGVLESWLFLAPSELSDGRLVQITFDFSKAALLHVMKNFVLTTINDHKIPQQGLDSVTASFTKWQPDISVEKTTIMLIGRHYPENCFFNLAGYELHTSNSARDHDLELCIRPTNL